MDIKFTDGKYTEVVGDYTVTVWESGNVYLATTGSYRDVADIDATDGALTFCVQDRERGDYGDDAQDRTIPLAVVRRMIELHDGVSK